MDPLYDLHSWSKHYREETLREAQQRHLRQRKRADGQPISMRSTFRLATSAALMVVIVALLLALPGAKPAKAALAGFREGQGPITFEKDGDVWVATRMGLANLTPNTATYRDVDPVVSPDGRRIAFASDRDGGISRSTRPTCSLVRWSSSPTIRCTTTTPVGRSTARVSPTLNHS